MNSVETGRRRSRKTELGDRIKTDRIVEFFPVDEENTQEKKRQEIRPDSSPKSSFPVCFSLFSPVFLPGNGKNGMENK